MEQLHCSVYTYCDFFYPWILEHKFFPSNYKYGILNRVLTKNYELLYDKKMVVILIDNIPQTMLCGKIDEVIFEDNLITVIFDKVKTKKYLFKNKIVLDFITLKECSELL